MIEFKEAKSSPRKRPAEKIAAGLKEALAVVKGEASPHRVHRPKTNAAAPKRQPDETPRRGRPAARPKAAVSIRLDQDLLDHFKAGGKGWQSRLNTALRNAAGLPR